MHQVNKKNIFVNEIELEYIVSYKKINYLSNILIHLFDYYFVFCVSEDVTFINRLMNLYSDLYNEEEIIIMIYNFICNSELEEVELKEKFLKKNKNEKIKYIKNIFLEKEPYNKNKIELLFNNYN